MCVYVKANRLKAGPMLKLNASPAVVTGRLHLLGIFFASLAVLSTGGSTAALLVKFLPRATAVPPSPPSAGPTWLGYLFVAVLDVEVYFLCGDIANDESLSKWQKFSEGVGCALGAIAMTIYAGMGILALCGLRCLARACWKCHRNRMGERPDGDGRFFYGERGSSYTVGTSTREGVIAERGGWCERRRGG